MAGARRVHVVDAEGVSLCGRFQAQGDPANLHARRRLTSAVTCRYCRAKYRAKAKRVATPLRTTARDEGVAA
jgi:hypothetical protein